MTTLWKNSTLKWIGVLVISLALILQLIAVATPGWMILNVETSPKAVANAMTGALRDQQQSDYGMDTNLFGRDDSSSNERNSMSGGMPEIHGYRKTSSESVQPDTVTKVSVSMGIWYMIVCVDTSYPTASGPQSICITMSYFQIMNFANQYPGENSGMGSLSPDKFSDMMEGTYHYVELAVESSICVLGCLIGLIFFCVSFRPLSSSRTYAGISSICLMTSGLLFLVPIGKLASINEQLTGSDSSMSQLLESAGVSIEASFAYSLLIAGFGASLALMQALTIMCYLCKNPRTAQGVVISNGAQLEAIPHGVIRNPYDISGYSVTVSSGPNHCGIPPQAFATGPMDAVSQPMPSEYGAKHSLVENPEINC